MDKKVTLIAKTIVASGGQKYGPNMQFEVTSEEAERLIKSGEAERVEDEKARRDVARPFVPKTE